MKKYVQPLRSEDGFILLLGMAMLIVLTLIGLSATRSSLIDVKIAGNEREIAQEFYVVDSSWQFGALWLNQKASAPDSVNQTLKSGDAATAYDTEDYYKIVRNYGEGGDGTTNEAFPSGTEDGTYSSIPFWYRVLIHDGTKPEGFGEDYEDFPVDSQASASGRTGISARMFKVLKVGY